MQKLTIDYFPLTTMPSYARIIKNMKTVSTLFFMLIFEVVSAQNIYVDGMSGNNSNTGTSTTAAWKTIQYAMTHANAGNTVYIRGGTYKEVLTLNVSGTTGNPITFTNYAVEQVYIDGNNLAVTLLSISGKSNIVIRGLIFQNTLGNNSAGVFIEGSSSNITFRKNKITNIRWIANASTIPNSNENCNPFVVYGNNASQAITNISIDSNEVYNNITGFSESMTLDGNVDGFNITHNLVHDNTNIGILCAGNYKVSSTPATDHSRNGLVQQNTTYNCTSSYATSGGIYIDGGQNIIVERNKSYSNGYGIEIGCEQQGTTSSITVRDNILFDNQVAGIAIGGYNYPTTGQVLNCLIENNSLYKNDNTFSGSGEVLISKAGSCMFKNNIVYTNAQNVAISSSYTTLQGNSFNYNAYYVPTGNSADLVFSFNTAQYSGLSIFKSSASQEASGMFTDPLFVNTGITNASTVDLSLQAGSLCINAGDPAHTIVASEKDYYGFGRITNTVIDLGAVEFGSVVTAAKSAIQIYTVVAFPNPVSDILTIMYDQDVFVYDLRIYNNLGEEFFHSNYPNTNNILNLEAFPKGIYILKITSDKGDNVQKIIKL